MTTILFFLTIILIVYSLKWFSEVSESNTKKYQSRKDAINFDANMLDYQKKKSLLESLLKNNHHTKCSNYKSIFDKIHSYRFLNKKVDLSFKNYELLGYQIEIYIENKVEYINESVYRAEDRYYELLNECYLKFNYEYYPLVVFVDIKEYYMLLNKLFSVEDSKELAENIGIQNCHFIYSSLKNIQYLFLREDIDIHQKITLESIIKKRISDFI